MEIELKTGEKLTLEVSSLLLEYLEDYEGGIEQLRKDSQGQKDKNGYTKSMRATNHLLYSIIASNYPELITYREAVRLVKLEDINKIADFVIKNTPSLRKEEIINKQKREFKHRL